MTKTRLFRRVGGKGVHLGVGVHLVNLKMTQREIDRLAKLAAEIKEQTGINVSRSFILREGARAFCIRLRRELEKAKRGELHAKKRKEPLYENHQEKEKVVILGQRQQQFKRRRSVGDYRPESIPLSRQGGENGRNAGARILARRR